jgi:dipeptidyl aminopeptidase/acylaminoacyl peptidase
MQRPRRAPACRSGRRLTSGGRCSTSPSGVAAAYRDYVCERLLYASDGLAVVAYLWRPATVDGRQLPLIVFNRGGNGEQQKLRPNTQFGFWRFVQADYVVLATQYRGNDGGEGAESWADGDVRDVLNLFPVAEKLGYIDMKNAFMLGYSRGALVTRSRCNGVRP